MAIQGLWAGPYLREVEGLDESAAATVVSLIGLAMVAGYALTGVATRFLAERGVHPVITAGAGMLAFLAVQALVLAHPPIPAWCLWSLYGFTGSTGVVCYAVLGASFPGHMTGRVNTALTLSVFACSFAVQAGIGAIVALWSDAAVGHRAAWLVLMATQAVAFAWYCLPRARAAAAEGATRSPIFKPNGRDARGGPTTIGA
jgi:hypothetical protein